jgi:hypothetical protein
MENTRQDKTRQDAIHTTQGEVKKRGEARRREEKRGDVKGKATVM